MDGSTVLPPSRVNGLFFARQFFIEPGCDSHVLIALDFNRAVFRHATRAAMLLQRAQQCPGIAFDRRDYRRRFPACAALNVNWPAAFARARHPERFRRGRTGFRYRDFGHRIRVVTRRTKRCKWGITKPVTITVGIYGNFLPSHTVGLLLCFIVFKHSTAGPEIKQVILL